MAEEKIQEQIVEAEEKEQEVVETKVESKPKVVEKGQLPVFKIFDLWEITEIKVVDPGLKRAINLQPKLILKSQGRNVVKFGQLKVNVVERLMNKVAVAGHRNKKHKIELGHSTGKYSKNMKIVLDALKLVEKRTNTNPVQILVNAIEKSSPREEVTIIEYGGARYPQAVDVSPVRRVNLALKHLVHGSSDRAFGKKKKLFQALAEEIMMAADDNGESMAVRKKKEAEAQADSAR